MSGTGSTLLALKDGLPGFGLYSDRKGRMVFAVEYLKNGVQVTKVIGVVNKISVEKARKLAKKLLSDPQIAHLRDPQPEPSQQARAKADGANAYVESRNANDKTRRRQTKALDESAAAKAPRKLVTFDELKDRYGIPYGRKHIARLEAVGDFPKRVQVGPARIAWVESEIEAFLEQRIAKRERGS